MDVRIEPHPLSGTIRAIPSKSLEHRTLILAALSSGSNKAPRLSSSNDIQATLRCLRALGCQRIEDREGAHLIAINEARLPQHPRLDVGESGSTLRFLLPVVAALGCGATFVCHGRLADRPLAPLDQQLAVHGVSLSRVSADSYDLTGTLTPGTFVLPGNVSSQFVSGLLMAAPLMDGRSEIVVSEPVESRAYIDLTINELARFGVAVAQESNKNVAGTQYTVFRVAKDAHLVSPGLVTIEGDWSDGAFWLAAASIAGTQIEVTSLDPQSAQGDRAAMDALADFGACVQDTSRNGFCKVRATATGLRACTVDVSGIPDLAAPLAAVASVAAGTTRFTGAARLRLKESDRLETIRAALIALGGRAAIEGDTLVIEGVQKLSGGVVDAANDHRIAMMAAICASCAAGPSIVRGADCVAKSHPSFFDDFRALGGIAQESEQ